MAKSDRTKEKFADALKQVMEEKPLTKITVDDIGMQCNMNRNSFYYHFSDKYELVNWIFQTEFADMLRNEEIENAWILLECLCGYFYSRKRFYRKILLDDNGIYFLKYLRNYVKPYAEEIVGELGEMKPEEHTFLIYSLTDTFLSSLRLWLISYPNMTAEEYFSLVDQAWAIVRSR